MQRTVSVMAELPAQQVRLLSMLCITIALCACGSEGDPQNTQPGTNNTTSQPTNNDTTADMDEVVEGEFEIGTNSASQADSFVPLIEGEEVPLVWGVQGSWMVVLAFRTHDLFEGMFDVRANISIDGVESGVIWLEFQETFPGGDGWDYYYNLFLAIDVIEPPPRGTPARIEMSVIDENETMAAEAFDVLIGETVGGPPP